MRQHEIQRALTEAIRRIEQATEDPQLVAALLRAKQLIQEIEDGMDHPGNRQ